jgi:hypothetical protein
MQPGLRALALCGAMVKHFFGAEWLHKHIAPELPVGGYLRLDNDVPEREKMMRIMRFIDFAEALYNLREIAGFEACLKQLADGRIESACAELDVARLLHVNGIPFRFVVPQQRRGMDYDFAIRYPDGLEVAADAKCKFETTAIDPKSVLNSLHDARTQLPKGKPGIIFVKVPPTWIETVGMANAIVETANEFFSYGTKRVVSVKFYAQPIIFTDEMTIGTHIYSEVSNPNALISDRNWDLFKGTRQTLLSTDKIGLPDWWVKFMHFPAGRPVADGGSPVAAR